MKQLFDKLNQVQFTYQFENFLHTVFYLRFKESVCTKKGQLFDIMEGFVNFNQHFKGIARMPGVSKKRFLREKIQNEEFISKEGKLCKNKADRIAVMHRNYQKVDLKLNFARKNP